MGEIETHTAVEWKRKAQRLERTNDALAALLKDAVELARIIDSGELFCGFIDDHEREIDPDVHHRICTLATRILKHKGGE